LVSCRRGRGRGCGNTGIKALAGAFRDAFAWYDANPGEPDNQLLSLAKLIGYSFPQYGREAQDEAVDNFSELLSMILTNPEMLSLSTNSKLSEEEKRQRMVQALASNPRQAKKMLKLIMNMSLRGE
jgi:hypothetical protein